VRYAVFMASNIEQGYQERILKVQIHIQNHLDDELSLEELARVAHFSEFHFHRVFTEQVGESIKSYVRRLRLERAIRDLTFTNMAIVQVAARAGYDSQQSFHRAFKEVYDKTPTDYRKQQLNIVSELVEKKSVKSQPISVDIKTLDAIKVAFIRHIGAYDALMETWLQLTVEIGLTHISSENTLKISIPYDSPDVTPVDKLRYDACVTIDTLADFKPKGRVGIQTIPAGKYAVITHYGSLESIESTYKILYGLWLPSSGYEPADHPSFMVHRKMPFQTPNDALETDIYLPVKRL